MDRFWIKPEMGVSLVCLFSVALIQSAVEKNPLAVERKEMHRARNGLRCTEKLKSHLLSCVEIDHPLNRSTAYRIEANEA
jgi:hypothetical protein